MTALTGQADQDRRVAELQAYAILGASADQGFADLVALAAQICRTPEARITLIDGEHQWGLCEGVFARLGRSAGTFCSHAILQHEPLIVPDARADPRFAASPPVSGAPFVRFYAGAPLISPSGVALGTLCVSDSVPRSLDDQQRDALVRLGRQAVALLELRRHSRALAESRQQHRDASDAFAASEWLFQSILAQLPDTVFVKDRAGRYALINEAGARMLGRTPAGIVGQTDWDIFLPEDAAPTQIIDREIMATGISRIFEESGMIDGQMRSFLTSKTPYRDRTGAVAGLIGIAHEITDRVRADERLRHSQQHLDGIVALSADAIISIDEQQRICLFNRAAERIFGYAAAEVLGQPLDLLIPERLRAAHAEHVRAFNATPNTVHAAAERPQVSGRRRDGSEFPLEGSISNVVVDGHVIATVCLRDVTEALRVQEQLRLLESAVYHTTEAVMITDADPALPDPRIVFVNPAFCAMSGYAAAEIIGRHPRILHGPQTDPAAIARLREELAAGRSFHGEIINYRKDGTPYYVEWTATPIRTAAGAISHFVALQRDISARVRTERQAQASDARIRRGMHRLQSLYSIGQAILSATSLEMIAQQAVHHIADLIPCSCASVVVFEPPAETQRTLAISVRGQGGPPDGADAPPGLAPSLRIGEPLVIRQSSGALTASRPVTRATAASRAFVSVPILARNQLIGSLNLEAEHDGGLSDEYIDIACEVANVLAVAIQHTQLFAQIQDGRDRLAQLSRQMIDIQEEERRHLARELHDEIGQALTVIRLNLHNLDGALATPAAQATVEDTLMIVQNLLRQI
ncbi:MAG TPA: PAS domain S-box protein, partial [Herpetosiphonaceae bacterium]|nr:PAS domain S-box protein [Herpetosiphonaceae bacterium]